MIFRTPVFARAAVGVSILASGAPFPGAARAQDVTSTQLCERYLAAPEVRSRFSADCVCIGRYLAGINADPVDVEVHFRLFASVYTGKLKEEADALHDKYGPQRYQSALEGSRGFLSGIMGRGGCRLSP